jgi:hypothetical protein
MMNSLALFLEKLKNNTNSVSFHEAIEIIDENYTFTPTAFKNGSHMNNAGENNGSCKIFGFAQLNQLNEKETLEMFGDYYFKDVLENPLNNDHLNIRNFMQFGWEGIHFEGNPLTPKTNN